MLLLDHAQFALDTITAAAPLEVPNPGDGTAPPGAGKFKDIMGWAKWLALGVCVVALIAAGAVMGFGGRTGDGGEHATRIGRVLVGVVVVSAAFSAVGLLV